MIVENEMALWYYDKYKFEENSLIHIIESVVSKKVMLRLYQIGLSYKNFLPIESLPESEKEKLRTECQGTGLKFSNRQMNNSCRILHTLKNIQ